MNRVSGPLLFLTVVMLSVAHLISTLRGRELQAAVDDHSKAILLVNQTLQLQLQTNEALVTQIEDLKRDLERRTARPLLGNTPPR